MKSELPPPAATKTPNYQRALQRFFNQLWVEISIGILILVSVGLTVWQIIEEGARGAENETLEQINHSITGLFAIELSLRYLSYPIKRRFFRDYWIDLLALLPLLRVFRSVRALRLLRLLRMLRLIGWVRRVSSYFPYVMRRGATEYLVVSGMLMLTVIFASAAILAFEGQAGNPEIGTWDDAFWFSLYSLFAGEPIPSSPTTLAGRMVAIFVMFMGVTIFAMFTGTVSAFMVDRLQAEGNVLDWDHYSDHTIICGWNSKAEIIIRQHCHAHRKSDLQIIAVTEKGDENHPLPVELRDAVRFLRDDFTRVAALEQAGIHRAKACIILSDTTSGRTEQDADARTILAALTVEKLNPQVYTCAELYNRSYGSHLEMGHVNDYVVNGEHSGYLLAQAALNHGLMGVYTELFTHDRGNQLQCLEVPTGWVGKSFFELFVHLKEQHDAILVAVCAPDRSYHVNPRDHQLAAGEQLVIIAETLPQLS